MQDILDRVRHSTAGFDREDNNNNNNNNIEVLSRSFFFFEF